MSAAPEATRAGAESPGDIAGSGALSFVDGLRAIAALGVVVLHAFLLSGHNGQSQHDLPAIKNLALDGNYSVAIFITMSGFVLMVPVCRAAGQRLRGGSLEYLKRRARRILPPYFAALVLVLALIAAVPLLQHKHNTSWDGQIPVTWGGVLSHVFLVNNVTKTWSIQIDGPMWSIATEWQIYLLMPLVLLPLWRRIRPVPTVVLALAAGLMIHHFLRRVDAAHYWFIGIFALGMLAAHVYVNGPRPRWLPLAARVVAAGVFIAYVFWRDQIAPNTPVSEIVVGAAMALLLAALGQEAREGKHTRLLRALQSRVLTSIGLFSYSLYLIHAPLLAVGGLLLLHSGFDTLGRFLVMLLVVAPMVVAVSYAFHRLVERRFMTTHQQRVVTDH
jgi:peptidoglycan/LPS O-acetylase OafA/YrhL